jgi:DNA-binding NarL/FixJ family response regulator
MYRKALKLFLQAKGTISVVGEAANGRAAVSLTASLNPNVILMDISMPKLNGLDACRQITTANPAAHVIILSIYNDEAYFQEAIRSGARGYLMKREASRILHNAIADTQKGKLSRHSGSRGNGTQYN